MPEFVRWTVFVFTLVLVAAGVGPLAGVVSSGTSAAPAYAWFHLLSAAIGLAFVFQGRGRGAAWFALGFGLVDLYQALASWAGWFPKDWFQWTPTDDVLHWALGAGLVLLGSLGLLGRAR